MLVRDPIPLTGDTVDDITGYLRIDTPDDDALIASLVASAIARAEGFCGQMLIQRNVTEQVQIWTVTDERAGWSVADQLITPNVRTRRDWKPLTALPVAAIAQVNALVVDGTSVPLSPAQFSVDIDAEGRGWVRIADQAITGRVSVLYTAGLASGWNTMPEAIRQGVIRLTSYMYTSRDLAGDSGPPAAVAALLRPWRRMRLSGGAVA
jgi:uncharacterized phiE125 gp8 family phage protein